MHRLGTGKAAGHRGDASGLHMATLSAASICAIGRGWEARVYANTFDLESTGRAKPARGARVREQRHPRHGDKRVGEHQLASNLIRNSNATGAFIQDGTRGCTISGNTFLKKNAAWATAAQTSPSPGRQQDRTRPDPARRDRHQRAITPWSDWRSRRSGVNAV